LPLNEASFPDFCQQNHDDIWQGLTPAYRLQGIRRSASQRQGILPSADGSCGLSFGQSKTEPSASFFQLEQARLEMTLLVDGVLLAVVGMGTVFAFLTIMVYWISFSSKILSRFAHLLPEQEQPVKKAPAPKKQEDSGALLAVIGAAVKRYRSTHK
jgi:sodium pump decarboxylase gamma subunit